MKPVTLTLVIYSAWTLMVFTLAFTGIMTNAAEFGISAHLWLTITGLPSSWVSWFFPYASATAILVAGVAGAAQWTSLAWLYSKFRHEQ